MTTQKWHPQKDLIGFTLNYSEASYIKGIAFIPWQQVNVGKLLCYQMLSVIHDVTAVSSNSKQWHDFVLFKNITLRAKSVKYVHYSYLVSRLLPLLQPHAQAH